jgi:hypothetical protein
MFVAHCENHTEHVTTICGQNAVVTAQSVRKYTNQRYITLTTRI